jgi:hypothetical protein
MPMAVYLPWLPWANEAQKHHICAPSPKLAKASSLPWAVLETFLWHILSGEILLQLLVRTFVNCHLNRET